MTQLSYRNRVRKRKKARGVVNGRGAAARLAQRVLANEKTIREKLDEESKTVQAIQHYRRANERKGGCRGCRRRRLQRWLAGEVRQLTGDEKTAVDAIIGSPD
jgi:hypothetical protein